jgi:molecular chaperone HscB
LTVNLSDTDFALFGLPQRFAQERSEVDARWKELQRNAHPDRFAGQGAAAERAALQWSVRINEAYRRLKDPLKRAAYLCQLRGAPIDAENNTAMPTEFLVEQMEWREALDDAKAARDLVALEKLDAELQETRKAELQRIGALLDATAFADAAQHIRKLMFLEKFAVEIAHILEQIDA